MIAASSQSKLATASEVLVSRFLLSVCDGCGLGCNEFAGHVQNNHVRFSFTEIAIIFLEIVKAVWTLCVTGYAKDAIVSTCHRTSDGQEHKIIWCPGPERDKIFHLRVTAYKSKAATGGQCAPAHSSRKSCERTARDRRANNFHLVTDKFAMSTDRKYPLNRPVMRIRMWMTIHYHDR